MQNQNETNPATQADAETPVSSSNDEYSKLMANNLASENKRMAQKLANSRLAIIESARNPRNEDYLELAVHDIKDNLSAYLRAMEQGRYRGIVIKRYNRSVAMLLPCSARTPAQTR